MPIDLSSRSAAGGSKTIARRDVSVSRDSGSGGRLHLGGGTYVPEQESEDNRVLRWAILAAVLFHLVLLIVNFPSREPEPLRIAGGNRAVYVVEPIRFQPPQPRPQETQAAKKKEVRRIPFPDPTPDDPEPIIDDEVTVDIPEIDLDQYGEALEIPTGPPGGGGAPGSGPIWIEGDVAPPEKVFAPQPRYTEEARKARVQGVVILQAVIDSLGNVTEVEVVKGLPEGLAESAVDTVRTWKYRPATLEGEPVAVYMNLTISFSLQ